MSASGSGSACNGTYQTATARNCSPRSGWPWSRARPWRPAAASLRQGKTACQDPDALRHIPLLLTGHSCGQIGSPGKASSLPLFYPVRHGSRVIYLATRRNAARVTQSSKFLSLQARLAERAGRRGSAYDRGDLAGPSGVRWHRFGLGGCAEKGSLHVRRGAAATGRRGPAGRGGPAAQRGLDGPRGRALDPDRAERGGQDHPAPGGRHLDVPHRGHGRGARRAPWRGRHLRPAAADRADQRRDRRAGPARGEGHRPGAHRLLRHPRPVEGGVRLRATSPARSRSSTRSAART